MSTIHIELNLLGATLAIFMARFLLNILRPPDEYGRLYKECKNAREADSLKRKTA